LPGATILITQYSLHCLTELRESCLIFWDPKSATKGLQIQVVVQKAGDSKYGTVIGQIHIKCAISSEALAELFYARDGTLAIGVSHLFNISSLKYAKVGDVAFGE
jgi:hypothetical protein